MEFPNQFFDITFPASTKSYAVIWPEAFTWMNDCLNITAAVHKNEKRCPEKKLHGKRRASWISTRGEGVLPAFSSAWAPAASAAPRGGAFLSCLHLERQLRRRLRRHLFAAGVFPPRFQRQRRQVAHM